MKIKFEYKITIAVISLSFQCVFSQVKPGNIGTEEVNVVKPYSPTISDAFKIKEIPSLQEDVTAKKESLKYAIFPFPVASTFTPSKGNAAGVEKTKQQPLFKNYATVGLGNYGTLNAELYVTDDLNNTEYVGGMVRHYSSQGGIKNVDLEDYFYDTSVDFIYGTNEKDFSWNLDLGYQNRIFNWYGLPSDFGSTLTAVDKNKLIYDISPQQSYNGISLGGKIALETGILKKADATFNHFWDGFDSVENRFFVSPTFQLDVAQQLVKTDVIVDYMGGSFKNNYQNTNANPVKYSFTNFGIVPTFEMQRDDWTLNIGAGIFYSLDGENTNSKFLIYPKLTASYKVVGDLMTFYAGAEGNLEQNTYMGFANENPFISPTLNISPTDKQYDIYAGLKGKLAINISYNVRGSYVNERNKALFTANNYTENGSNSDYGFGNSFQIVYDDLKTVSFYGELKADFSKNVTFAIDGTFSSYTNQFQNEAWNLPTIKLNSKLDFNLTEKWYAGFNLFYVGERKDQQINTDVVYVTAPGSITLPSYFDLNAHVGFKYNDRLTAFLRANNITNKQYQKWLNYPVQGFQIVVGANYKFDF